MIDPVTLDQLRTFIAAVDEGSFSAAGRKLGRAQSVVSQTIAGLEVQLQVTLFERVGRYPVPTDAGNALAREARAVLQQAGQFKARAQDLARGIEPELAIAIDATFPTHIFTSAVTDFQAMFPDTKLRVYVESLGGVIQPVLERRYAFAVSGVAPLFADELQLERLHSFKLIMVAAASHPLAKLESPVRHEQLSQHVQLVLTDRSSLTAGKQFGVIGQKTWLLADLGAKHAFLLAGLGWGGMPAWMVASDIASGTLVELNVEHAAWSDDDLITAYTLHRRDTPPGPAGRWLMNCLAKHAAEAQDM